MVTMAQKRTPQKKPAPSSPTPSAHQLVGKAFMSRRKSDRVDSPVDFISPAKHPARRKGDWVTCAISGKKVRTDSTVALNHIRPTLAARILSDFPDLEPTSRITNVMLSRYRMRQVQDMLREDRGDLSALEQEVATSVAEHVTLSSNLEEEISDKRTLGERLADQIASFGGSWTFIIIFFCFLGAWMAVNIFVVFGREFDPYPFILLNLCLSCLAAIQAPIIMMSQNRQEAKDRLRSEHDYQINLKAELEIRLVHEKLDHLITKQWERLSEVQQIQTELLHDLTTRKRR